MPLAHPHHFTATISLRDYGTDPIMTLAYLTTSHVSFRARLTSQSDPIANSPSIPNPCLGSPAFCPDVSKLPMFLTSFLLALIETWLSLEDTTPL